MICRYRTYVKRLEKKQKKKNPNTYKKGHDGIILQVITERVGLVKELEHAAKLSK